jgi:cobalt/nickel transport system permease protein
MAGLFLLMLSMGLERVGSRERPSCAMDLPPALGSLFVSLGILVLSRIPPSFVMKKLKGSLGFLLLVLVIFPLAYPEKDLDLGFFAVASDGILVAVLIILRATAILVLVFPALGTSRFDVTMKALRRLRVPSPLVQIVLFTYRYLFVYADQVRRMEAAWRARGFRVRANLHTARTLGNGLGVLLVSSIERTQRIQSAMKARGFSGSFRTFEDFKTSPKDVTLFSAIVALGLALFLWRARVL